MNRHLIIYLAVILLILTGGNASAQLVTANNNLVFGNVFPGIPKAVDKATAGGAAEFFITGTAGDEVAIDFDLPKYLAGSGFTMRTVFLETDCALDSSASPSQSTPGADDLDPWQTINYRIGSSGLTVWLGGMLIPQMGQPPGAYTAIVTITVSYTGN